MIIYVYSYAIKSHNLCFKMGHLRFGIYAICLKLTRSVNYPHKKVLLGALTLQLIHNEVMPNS